MGKLESTAKLDGWSRLKEARNVGDFERVYSWGLGVSGTGCFRVFTLTGPDRLVIDVQAG